MSYSPCAEAEFLSENAVNEVSLLYCEPTGTPTVFSVSTDRLPDILAAGLPHDNFKDLILLPDSDTFTLLPTENGLSAFFCCNLCTKDGEPAPLDSRAVLQKTLRRAANQGIFPVADVEITDFPEECSYFSAEQDPLDAADQLFITRAFNPAPASCSMKLTLSLCGEDSTPVSADTADGFIAGLMALIAETTAFLSPCSETYLHRGTSCVAWSDLDPTQLIYCPGDRRKITLQLLSPAANPYLAFAALISAGLEGVLRQLPLPAPLNTAAAALSQAELLCLHALPPSLTEALFAARYSGFLRKLFGAEIMEQYITGYGLITPYPERPDGFQKRYFSVP